MPIFYTSYRDDEITRQIDKLVGKPYGLIDRIKMGGNGCKRMKVLSISSELEQYINDPQYPSYVSIELRPNGILVFLSKNMRRYTWPIPNTALSVQVAEVLHERSDLRLPPITGLEFYIKDAEYEISLEDYRADNKHFVNKLRSFVTK